MCNEYQLTLPVMDVLETFAQGGDPVALRDGLPNLAPSPSIRIGDRAPIIALGAQGAELRLAPWAWRSPHGRSVFNFRSDGRSFAGSARCLIPADGFFEFTAPEPGQKRKTRWRFRLARAPLFWVAGIVRDGAFAMLTTTSGPDIGDGVGCK